MKPADLPHAQQLKAPTEASTRDEASVRFTDNTDLHTYLPLQALLVALTFVTGMLDAVTYLDVGHVFAANMTGNFILLGLGVLRANDLSVVASVVAVTGFLIGVAGGGRLARSLESQGQRWVMVSLAGAAGLSLLGLVATVYRAGLGDYPALVLFASAMGLINATASRIGVPGLTTTLVITSTLTNLVSGTQLVEPDRPKRLRQIAAVAAIVVGAIVGGALLLRFGAIVAIGTAVIVVLATTIAYLLTLRNASVLRLGKSAQ